MGYLIKERPIIFSDDMVRAILDGKKTMTRRIVKGKALEEIQTESGETILEQGDDLSEICVQYFKKAHSGAGLYLYSSEYPEEGCELIKSPYGTPGNRLWVRHNHRRGQAGEPNDQVWDEITRTTRWKTGERIYDHGIGLDAKGKHPFMRKKSSIYMPRWASLITLGIVNIRVERLHDATEEDAIAEGVRSVTEFKELWESIKGKESWELNPWVWVIEFKVIEPDIIRQSTK